MNCDFCFPTHEITGKLHRIPAEEIQTHARQYAKMIVAELGALAPEVFKSELEEMVLDADLVGRARADQTDWAACDRAYALWQRYKDK